MNRVNIVSETTISGLQHPTFNSRQKFSFRDPHRLFLNIIFSVALFLTLLKGPHAPIARGAWVALTVLFTLEPTYRIIAIFFFSAFFMPSGIYPNSLFTIKHFHIAIMISLLVDVFRGSFVATLQKALPMAKNLSPLFAILLIGALPLVKLPVNWLSLKLTGNFALVLISLICWRAILCKNLSSIRIGTSFFVWAICLQIANGMRHDLLFPDPFSYRILHNNHLAVLAAIAAFHALGLVLTSKSWREGILHWTSLAVIFLGLVYSCSRTAWLGFGVSFFMLGYATLSNPRFQPSVHKISLVLVIGVLMFAGVLIGQALMNKQVLHRIFELGQLMSQKTWEYTLNDTQNFGFLGIFRLQQLYFLWGILKPHPLTGIGFTHDVIGFHGFYFTILGASGFLGLLIFAFYIRNTFKTVILAMNHPNDYRALIFYITVFSSLSAWLLCSFMESLFLQYGFWINLVLLNAISTNQASFHDKSQ